jgi:two-component system sensor histidine kinase/response regulator
MQKKIRILLIDHATLHSLILHRIIGEEGYSCNLANGKNEALSLLKENRYDLIILDVTIMEIEGLDLLNKLKSNPQFVKIPVIALSVREDTQSLNKALNLGASDSIIKPFNIQELLDKITIFLPDTAIKEKQD